MEITQEEIYEALGMEAPKQEPQEPQNEPQEPTGTGENEQQAAAAAPEESGAQGAEEPQEPSGTGENAQQVADAAQREKDDRNAAFAAARRKAEAERDRAIAAEKAKAEQRIQKIFQQAGMVDPASGRAIASEQELEAFAKRMGEEKKNQLREQGITDEDIQMLPEMQQKEQELARYRAQAAERALADEMRKIEKLDGSVKTLADLHALPEYQDIYERVGRGYTLADAFTLATAERRAQQSESKKPAAKLDGKQHLQKSAGGGGSVSSVVVPEETMRIFRYMFPDKTKKELTEYYAKNHKKK